MKNETGGFIRGEVEAAVASGAAEAIIRMVGIITGWVEDRIAETLDEVDHAPIACGPGCPHCCVLTVSVLIPEAMAIADHLRRNGRVEILPTLKDFVARIRWMEDGERAWREIFCPFLDKQGACSIHAVRPLLCRSVSSTDPNACRAALNQTEESDSPMVIMNMAQKQIVERAFLQLARSLQEAGRDSRSVELVRCVSAILEQPGLELDFIRGRPLNL